MTAIIYLVIVTVIFLHFFSGLFAVLLYKTSEFYNESEKLLIGLMFLSGYIGLMTLIGASFCYWLGALFTKKF